MDAFIQREKYLKGTYESLSGVEMDVSQTCDYQGNYLRRTNIPAGMFV